MGTSANKAYLRGIFAAAATGDSGPLVEALAEDVRWTIIGATPWSGLYSGKRAVIEELLAPLGAQLAGPIKVTAQRVVADGDTVVVEGRIHNDTVSGRAYPNRYCWVFVLHEGRIVEVTEYPDTQLLAEVLSPPPVAGTG